MPITVNLPDGRGIARFPDGTAPEVMEQAIRDTFYPEPQVELKASQTETEFLNYLADIRAQSPTAGSFSPQPPPESLGVPGGWSIEATQKAMPLPEATPLPIEFMPQIPVLKGKSRVAGAERAVAEFVNGIVSDPTVAMAIPIGGIASPLVKRLVAGYFLTHAITAAKDPQYAQRVAELVDSPEPSDRVQGITTAILGLGAGGALAKGTFGKYPVLSEAKLDLVLQSPKFREYAKKLNDLDLLPLKDITQEELNKLYFLKSAKTETPKQLTEGTRQLTEQAEPPTGTVQPLAEVQGPKTEIERLAPKTAKALEETSKPAEPIKEVIPDAEKEGQAGLQEVSPELAPKEQPAAPATTEPSATVGIKVESISAVEPLAATENGGRIALIMPNGIAIVGGRIHADTWNKAIEKGVANDVDLQNSIAGFVKPDGTAWGVNGKSLPKVSQVIIVGNEIPKPPALSKQRPPAPGAVTTEGVIPAPGRAVSEVPKPPEPPPQTGTVKQPWEMTRNEFGVPVEPVDTKVDHYRNTERIARERPNDLTEADKALLEKTKQQQRAHNKYLKLHKEYTKKSNDHFYEVEKALREGKPVPPEVLADYPDLKPAPHSQPFLKDEAGNDLEAFHGTPEMEFDPARIEYSDWGHSGPGIYLTTDKGIAENVYAKAHGASKAGRVLVAKVVSRKPFGSGVFTKAEAEKMNEALVKNGYTPVKNLEGKTHKWLFDRKQEQAQDTWDSVMKDAGYDSVRIQGADESEMVVYDPKQLVWKTDLQQSSEPTISSESGFGIIPPGARWLAEKLDPVIEYLRADYATDPPKAFSLDKNPLPAFAAQELLRSEVTRPHGFGKVPIAGRFYDARFKGNDPVRSAFIIYDYLRGVGRGIATITGARFEPANKSFKVNRRTQKVENVKLKPGQSPYLEDIAREWYKDPTSYDLTPDQIDALLSARNVFDRMLKLMADEGIPKAEALKALLERAEEEGDSNNYFPRIWLGKEKVTGEGKSMGGLTQTPAQLRERKFPTQQEGVQAKHIYETQFSKIIATYVNRAYNAIAARRLMKDPALGGQTPRMRLEAAAEEIFPELGVLKSAIGSASSEAQAKAIYSKYTDVFDELRSENKDTFAELAASTSSAKATEGTVAHPSFMGYIYDKDVAQQINSYLRSQSHPVIEKLSILTTLSNAFKLALDNSAPFVQGLPALFYSLSHGKNIWGRAYAENIKSFFDTQYMARIMSNPVYRELANEWVQLGGSVGRLQDYMAGTAEGGPAARLPWVGGAFKRAGAAFGAFSDMSKLEWWRAIRQTAPRNEWVKIVEGIENLTGTGRTTGAKPGVVQAEGLVALASAYYRSGLNVLANLAEWDTTGKITWQALGSMLAGTTLAAVGGMYAVGLSKDEIVRKVSNMDLTVPVEMPNGKRINVSFSHITLSLLKLAVRQGLYMWRNRPENLSFGEMKKFGVKMTSGGVEGNPILRFLWGHAAPIPSATTEMLLGRDYMGEDTTWGQTLVKQFTPLGVQQVGGTLMKADTVSAVGDAMGTVMGLNAYPESYRQEYNRRLNAASRKMFGKDKDQLSINERFQLDQSSNIRKSMGKRPPPTRMEEEAAKNKAKEIVADLFNALSEDSRRFLNQQGLSVGGYDVKLKRNDAEAYLRQEEQERLKVIVAEKIDKLLINLRKSKYLTNPNISVLDKQEFLQKRTTRMKEIAKNILIAESARASKPAK